MSGSFSISFSQCQLQLWLQPEKALRNTTPWEESGQLLEFHLKCLRSTSWMPICRRHWPSRLCSQTVSAQALPSRAPVCTGNGVWGPSPFCLWKLVLLCHHLRHATRPYHMVWFQSSMSNLNLNLMYIWGFFESWVSQS